jgi:hypothetical protein
LAETPLMLSVIALAYKDKKADELPTSHRIEDQRNHLFKAYVDRMFERPTRSTYTAFTKSDTLHYLSWLARNMIEHNIITFQVDPIERLWIENLPQGRLFLRFSRLIIGLILGLSVGLPDALSLGLLGGILGWLLGEFKLGLLGGLVLGFAVGFFFFLGIVLIGGYGPTAQNYLIIFVLARHKLLPWHLIPLLDYAVDLILLRRVGGSYIFVHRLLMEYFAKMDA